MLSLLALGLLAGAPPETLATLTNVVTVAVSNRDDLAAISTADIERAIEFEAQRQMVGCASSDSCLGEIAGAMGARWVVFGEVGELGRQTVVTLSLFDSESASSVARRMVQAEDFEVLGVRLHEAARQLVEDLEQTRIVVLELSSAAPVEVPPRPLVWIGGVTIGAGLMAGAVGGLFGFASTQADARLQSARLQSEAVKAIEERDAAATWANVFFVSSAACVVMGAGLLAVELVE